MKNTTDRREEYRRDYVQREARLPGQGLPWLRAQRRQALEYFMDTGFPTFQHEDWKYTDVRPIAKRRFVPADGVGHVDAAALAPYALPGHQLVFVDGRYQPALSRLGPLPDGARLLSLGEALARDPALVEGRLGACAGPARHGFAALNSALLQDGAVVYLHAGTVLEEPIHLLFVSTGAPDAAAYPRNLIVAEAGSQATVIESYLGRDGGPTLTDALSEVTLEPGAALEHYRLEREAESGYHIGATHVRLARDSRYSSHAVALGARLARHELYAALEAEGAECALNGLYVGRGRQHLDQHTRIDHCRPRGTSRELYKGVLDGEARGVFSGRVVVHPDARKSDAEQANHNLLLSDTAEADSRPQLEIYADDVKCAHGSSTGSLDPDQLFYLRSRALDEALARNLLVYAFARDVLARMRLAPLRLALERQFAGRLLAGHAAEELLS
jgi:Fe-S cluster assembly protein SufD